jgi:seryl-tRNA synthetase
VGRSDDQEEDTMPSFMDKVKQAAGGVAEATKKGAATAQTKAKVHGLRGKADEAAQKLGYLVHRERSGGEAAGAEADELVTQITALEAEIAELQAASEEGEEGTQGAGDDATPTT